MLNYIDPFTTTLITFIFLLVGAFLLFWFTLSFIREVLDGVFFIKKKK
jgi:hypothetical protein